jgi:hypothetical protein
MVENSWRFHPSGGAGRIESEMEVRSMSTQGSAQAPDLSGVEHDEKKESTNPDVHAASKTPWKVWKQVIIGELLNVLERRRYDESDPR